MTNWHTVKNHGPSLIEVVCQGGTTDTLATGEKVLCAYPPASIKIVGDKSARFEVLPGQH